MSHFSVLVIGDDVDAALAPFQENNMGDCPKQYLAFTDREDEMRDDYANKTSTRVVMPDGRLLTTWDDSFREAGTFGHAEAPAHLERREVPFTQLFATFEDYAASWCGHSDGPDEKTGRYGYWENPNKKWDWYKVGGRWANDLLLKDGETLVDTAPAGEIDWQAMIDKQARKVRDDFATMRFVLGDQTPKTWEQCRDEVGGDINMVRDAYHAQPLVAALGAAFPGRWGVSDLLEGYIAAGRDEETYVQFQSRSRARQYAILHKGVWYQPGQMGWFGCSDQTAASVAEFTAKYWEIVFGLAADETVTVVDCHI